MALYYSPSTGGFFSSDMHADIPADRVEITAERHAQLLAGQANGGTIVPGKNGRPCLSKPAVTLADRRAALVRMTKKQAARRIEAFAPIWRQVNDQRDPTPDGAARFAAIDAIRTASNQIEAEIAAATASTIDAIDIPNHPLWPVE